MSRPNGHTAVMASRAATPPDSLDYFPTPPWAARAGGELIRRIDPKGVRTGWEPACGEGHMAYGLADYFDQVLATDIHRYGPRQGPHGVMDFLQPEREFTPGLIDWIVTNPPFVKGEAFVRAAWPRARRGVAMLLRLSFLEGAARYRLLYDDLPLYCVAPFAERVPMVKGRWDPDASSATAYAWFVWCKPAVTGGLREAPKVMPIPPGTKARLSKPGDVVAFGAPGPAPLVWGPAR